MKKGRVEELGSRRDFLKKSGAFAAGAVGASILPAPRESAAASTVMWRVQTVWDTDTLGFDLFADFCASVNLASEGKFKLEPMAVGTVVRGSEMFDAVRAGVLDAMMGFESHWAAKQPVSPFLTSYPMGMGTPDLWETWYDRLGGSQIADEAYGKYKMAFLGPIQYGHPVIFSKVPLRNFDEFKGKKLHVDPGMASEFYRAAGAEPVNLDVTEAHDALDKGKVDATAVFGAARGYYLGLGEITKYVVLGPPSTPSLHRGADLMSLVVGARKWGDLSASLKLQLRALLRLFSWRQYAAFQQADMEACRNLRKEQKMEIIRLAEEDLKRFQRAAPAIWVKSAKKSPLAAKALKSQIDFQMSPNVGLLSESDLVDEHGKKLSF